MRNTRKGVFFFWRNNAGSRTCHSHFAACRKMTKGLVLRSKTDPRLTKSSTTKGTSFVYQDKRGFFLIFRRKSRKIRQKLSKICAGEVNKTFPALFLFEKFPHQITFLCSGEIVIKRQQQNQLLCGQFQKKY